THRIRACSSSAPVATSFRVQDDRNGKMTAPSETATSLLIVEDNDVEREGLSAILRREGFVTCEAENGAQALERLRAGKPDLILLDMLLPGTHDDGWTVLERIRTNPAWADIPVIIVTGLEVASQEWARSLGARAIVRKPVHTEELMHKIRHYAC